MINFRFHLISLIAVFLALALGVVMGYGVLGEPTVDTLQDRIDTVEGRANRVREENGALRQENARLENAMKSVDDYAVTSRLNNTGALPVAVRGVDDDQVTEFVRLARRGGGAVPGIVWLEEKWGLDNAADASELAAILGSTASNRTVLRDVAARALATRLAGGPATAPGRQDLLTQLESAGFIGVQEVDGLQFEPAAFDGRGGRILAIGGSNAALVPDRSTTALAQALVTLNVPVVVADDWRSVEGGPERGDALAPIRDDGTLESEVATFDAFDSVDGPLVSVLVIGERGQGVIGHYGFGRGADRTAPEWWTV